MRVELAYARSNPAIVYASVDVNGGSIYKSTNGGASFSAVFNGAPDYLGTQGWYGNALWVDPTNATPDRRRNRSLEEHQRRRVLHADQQLVASPASPHADHHAIVEQPGFNGTLEHDGVVHQRRRHLRNRPTCTPLACAIAPHGRLERLQQQPRASPSSTAPAGGTATGVILGGTQDNGTLKWMPATGTTWSTEFGGDGGASAVDPSNNNNLYGEYTYGAVHRSTDGGASADWINGIVWNGVQVPVASPPPTAIADTCQARSRGEFRRARSFSIPTTRTGCSSAACRCGGRTTRRRQTPQPPGRRGRASSRRAAPATTSARLPLPRATRTPSGSGTTTDSCSRRPTARRRADVDRERCRHASQSIRDARARRSDRRQHRLRHLRRLQRRNVWKTTNGGTSWAPRRAAASPDCRPFPSATSPSTRAAHVAVCRDRSRPVHEHGRRQHVDGPGRGPANVSVEELFWMGASLVAVTHGRGLFRATPSTEIEPETPVITWPAPAPIPCGTALSATQLNATTTVPGTFVYTPAAGAQLPIGTGHTLSVTFTPDRHRQLHRGHGERGDRRRRQADAGDHVVDAGRHRLRHGVERARNSMRPRTVPGTFTYTAGRRHGPLGRHRPGADGDVHADRHGHLHLGDGNSPDRRHGDRACTIDAVVSGTRLQVRQPGPRPRSRPPRRTSCCWHSSAPATASRRRRHQRHRRGTDVDFRAAHKRGGGTAEIWRAFASAPLTNVTVPATISANATGSLTVVSFKNVDTSGTTDPVPSAQRARQRKSWPAERVADHDPQQLVGVRRRHRHDQRDARARGSGPDDGPRFVAQRPRPIMSWVQRRTNPTPVSGTNVTINDTAPLRQVQPQDYRSPAPG